MLGMVRPTLTARLRQASLGGGLVLLASALLLPIGVLVAQDLPGGVQVHGFGGASYGRTNLNRYLSGIPKGDYRKANFALNVSAHPTERLAIVSQIEVVQSPEETEAELDYTFAEWRFSDAIRLQAGRIKHPFGIYTEVFDVGTLRPFLTLPQSIYASVGIISESYTGIGLRGRMSPARGWSLAYNVYGGGISLFEDYRPLAAFEGTGDVPEGVPLRDVLGTRITLSPPVVGLSFGISSYTGLDIDEGDEREVVFGVHAEYLTDRLWLRSEAARQWEGGGPRISAQYVEVAVFLTRRIQTAFMYDRLRTASAGTDGAAVPELLRHSEAVFGLNYWPSAELGFKSSLHFVKGNRLAFPDGASVADLQDPDLDRRATRLVQFGVQFSF